MSCDLPTPLPFKGTIVTTCCKPPPVHSLLQTRRKAAGECLALGLNVSNGIPSHYGGFIGRALAGVVLFLSEATPEAAWCQQGVIRSMYLLLT